MTESQMYHVTLTHYAVPEQKGDAVLKPGNFDAAVSAVRAIYHALNARAREYDVLVTGVNRQNLESLAFSVTGGIIKSRDQESFSHEQRYNVSPSLDLPTLAYILETDLTSGLDEKLFHQGEEGSSALDNKRLRISHSPVGDSWMMRIFSRAVKYEIVVTDSPDYFERSVSLDIEVDELEMDGEDRRAILEVATVLADVDFREDGRFEHYVNAKGGKKLDLFQVYELSGIDTQGSDESMGLHSILADEHYSSQEFFSLNEDNLEEVVPRYLVIADKLRRNKDTLEGQLSLDLARHHFSREQLASESPDARAVLDVEAQEHDDIKHVIDSYLSEHRGQVYGANRKSEAHRGIRAQMAEYEARMSKQSGNLSKVENVLDRLEKAGITRSQGFEKYRFLSRAARSGLNELAMEAVVLLKSLEGRL